MGDPAEVKFLSVSGGAGHHGAGGDLAVCGELPREHGGDQDLDVKVYENIVWKEEFR